MAEQARNTDEVPVQNLCMENLGTVTAASRRKSFKRTQHLLAVRVERETKGPAEGGLRRKSCTNDLERSF